MELKDKYNLTREENVFVAKKYLKDSVYRSAYLEGIAVTFPQTEQILENGIVSGVTPREIAKVCELRDAWRYVLDSLDAPVDLKYLKDLHEIIAREDVEWSRLGELRHENVRISGTNYMPEVPAADEIVARLAEILASDTTDTDKAVTLMLYIMRAQPFLDGNKRVATFVCNRVLIANGRGVFSLPPELKQEFGEKLIHYYESGEMDAVKELIYNNCITGL